MILLYNKTTEQIFKRISQNVSDFLENINGSPKSVFLFSLDFKQGIWQYLNQILSFKNVSNVNKFTCLIALLR